jgi:hypothetical protein
MKFFKNIILLLGVLLSLTSCSDPNFFKQFSKQDSDEALYHEALKKIDALDWDAAINIMANQLSASYKQSVKVRESLMGAYAGKCGLSFVTLVSGLASSTGGIFKLALGAFGGLQVDVASCDSAALILQSLGSSTERTQNQNLYAAILGLTKLGVNLHNTLDTESSGIGDGAVDGGSDVCAEPVSTTAGQLTDAEIKKVIVGTGLIFENIATLAAAIGTGNAGVDSMNAAKTACEAIAGVGNCTITDEGSTAITPQAIRFFRRLVASSSMGVGSCDISVPLSCCPALAVP